MTLRDDRRISTNAVSPGCVVCSRYSQHSLNMWPTSVFPIRSHRTLHKLSRSLPPRDARAVVPHSTRFMFVSRSIITLLAAEGSHTVCKMSNEPVHVTAICRQACSYHRVRVFRGIVRRTWHCFSVFVTRSSRSKGSANCSLIRAQQ